MHLLLLHGTVFIMIGKYVRTSSRTDLLLPVLSNSFLYDLMQPFVYSVNSEIKQSVRFSAVCRIHKRHLDIIVLILQ